MSGQQMRAGFVMGRGARVYLNRSHTRQHCLTVAEATYPGFQGKQSFVGAFEVLAADNRLHLRLFHPKSGENARRIPLAIAPTRGIPIQSSTAGLIAKNSFFIDVVFRSSGMCVSNVEMRLPIVVYTPQPPPDRWAAQCQTPPGWQPQMFENVAIGIPAPPQNSIGMPPPMMPTPKMNPAYGNTAPMQPGYS